jgi:hypothetical protein
MILKYFLSRFSGEESCLFYQTKSDCKYWHSLGLKAGPSILLRHHVRPEDRLGRAFFFPERIPQRPMDSAPNMGRSCHLPLFLRLLKSILPIINLFLSKEELGKQSGKAPN